MVFVDLVGSTELNEELWAAVERAGRLYERTGNLASAAQARSLLTDIHGLAG